MEERTSILWFRNDLRLSDNEALAAAVSDSTFLLPVYCFDPRDYGMSGMGVDRTGPARASFILDCVAKLKQELRERGSDLVVRLGMAEDVLLDLAVRSGATALYAHHEVSPEDIHEEIAVAAALERAGVEIRFFWTGTLIHIDDLPFSMEQMPQNHVGFCQTVRDLEVRQPLGDPKKLVPFPNCEEIQCGDLPTLKDLGLEPVTEELQDDEARHVPPFMGGEAAALKCLKNLISGGLEWSTCDVGLSDAGDSFHGATLSDSRESLHGSNFCAMLSPWLAIGCLSPQQIYDQCKKSRSANSIDWKILRNSLMFELLWRDFFRFITKAYVTSNKGVDVTTAMLDMKSIEKN